MNAPTTPRIYAKEVTIHRESYRQTHGREPRGYGTWVFAPRFAELCTAPDGHPITNEQAAVQLMATVKSFAFSTYTGAARAASRHFAAQNITQISVLP